MKKALIFQGKLVEVATASFPVSPEMHWVDVADDVNTKTHEWDGALAVLTKVIIPTYRELRARAYPPISDQFDAMWKGGEPEAAMQQIILAVKAKFPKT